MFVWLTLVYQKCEQKYKTDYMKLDINFGNIEYTFKKYFEKIIRHHIQNGLTVLQAV